MGTNTSFTKPAPVSTADNAAIAMSANDQNELNLAVSYDYYNEANDTNPGTKDVYKRQIQKEHAFNQTHDFLTGCLNWSSYDSYLLQSSNEVLSSLGVLYTDINHLGDLNYQYGKDYGNRLIKFIASCLQDEFGQQSVYRLAGDKFVVFREDITYDKFIEKVERSHSLIEEQYPCCVSFGYTWADEDIFPEQMLQHATDVYKRQNSKKKSSIHLKGSSFSNMVII